MKVGIHFNAAKIYAQVVKWNSICTLLALVTVDEWHTVQLDYVLAYPQAPVEREISMQILKDFELEGANKNR